MFEGWWVPRGRVRQEVKKYMGDTGMMDFMLKAISNQTIGSWAVFRYAQVAACADQECP